MGNKLNGECFTECGRYGSLNEDKTTVINSRPRNNTWYEKKNIIGNLKLFEKQILVCA